MRSLKPIFLLLFVCLSQNLKAQRSFELFGSVGYTGVDETEFAGAVPVDWNKTMSGIHLQAFLADSEPLSFGIEFGYSYLFWYDISLTLFGFPGGTITREVDASRLMGVGRLKMGGNLFLEFAAGAYFFEDFTDFVVAAGIGYRINLNDQFSIPLKARGDLILDADAIIVPIGLSGGIAYSF